MEDNDHLYLHQNPKLEQELEEEEEEDEALSLSELPLNSGQHESQEMFKNITTNRRSSSEPPPDFFEFFSDFSSDHMSSAEDIIFCGKLIPFKEQAPKINFPGEIIDEKQTAFRRRSESLSELQSTGNRSNSVKAKVMRNSRSLDYQKLRRSSNSMVSPAPEMDRNSSIKSVGKSEASPKKAARLLPRWSAFLMFGMVKFPAEMELSDIKSRQVRRNPSTLLPPIDSSGNLTVSRSSGKGGSWKLLKALSCKDHASVAVTTSFYVPQV
ncbi:hypothetical protein UlMin_004378 [Ulmus minor]